jgi:biopolymer transport protein ExbD
MTSPACVRRPLWPIAKVRRRRSLISLTPLIEVVFILLVFFMLASSFLDWRSITLSAPSAGAASASMEGAVLVEIRTAGLRLSGRPIGLDGLEASIRTRVAEKPDQAVFVKPAAGVPLQQAVAVLDRLSAAGVRDLSLIRDRAR